MAVAEESVPIDFDDINRRIDHCEFSRSSVAEVHSADQVVYYPTDRDSESEWDAFMMFADDYLMQERDVETQKYIAASLEYDTLKELPPETPVYVDWEEGCMFGAILMEVANGKCFVQFDEDDLYDAAWVHSSQIRLKDGRNLGAKSYRKDNMKFYAYYEKQNGQEFFELTDADISEVQESEFSEHAKGRYIDRYTGEEEEFKRDIDTPEDWFYQHQYRHALYVVKETEKYEIECKLDFTKVYAIRVNGKKHKTGDLEHLVMDEGEKDLSFLSLMGACCNFPPKYEDGDVKLNLDESDRESIYSSIANNCFMLHRRLVVTAMSTIIVSLDWQTIVSCYKNRKKYSKWNEEWLSRRAKKTKGTVLSGAALTAFVSDQNYFDACLTNEANDGGFNLLEEEWDSDDLEQKRFDKSKQNKKH